MPPEWITVIGLWVEELTPLCILITAILWNPIKILWKKYVVEPDSEQDKRLDTIDETLKIITNKIDNNTEINIMLLHSHLYRLCKESLSKGYITYSELGEIKQIYDTYHEMGGNGTGTTLFEECKKLRKKDED